MIIDKLVFNFYVVGWMKIIIILYVIVRILKSEDSIGSYLEKKI